MAAANRKPSIAIFVLSLVFVAGAGASLATGGRSDVGLVHFFELILRPGESLGQSVMFDLRMPRTIVAALLGINLGLAGMILQAITRNPLASPSILGVNQGAALGMVVGLLFPGFLGLGLTTLAIVGAVAAGGLTFLIAGGFHGQLNSLRLILGGVAVGAFAYAVVRFSFTLEDELARQVVRWTVGNIGDSRWSDVLTVLWWSIGGLALSVALSHRFNLMALGDASAQGLGADPRVTLLLGAAIAAALTGSSVAVAGPIGFVGLVVPHMVRLIFGADHRVLVPATALLGATLMVVADAASKWLTAPFETPVGVVVALIGAPYFLYQTLVSRDLG